MQASFLTNTSKSFAATLDARLKLGLCATGSISIIIFSSPISLALLLIPSLALAFTAAKPSTLARILLFVAFITCTTLAFSGLLTLVIPIPMHWDVLSLLTPFLRMLVAVMLLITLALSTPVQVIAGQIQWFRLPGVLYIPITIAIRFIPVFMADCKQIRDAARLRPGSGFSSLLRGLVVPLIFRTLSSADDLAVAAALKGIQAQKKAVLPEVGKLNSIDLKIMLTAILVLEIAIAVQIWGPQFAGAMSR